MHTHVHLCVFMCMFMLVHVFMVHEGDAIMHLKALGFDNDEIRHRVVAYCPQVCVCLFACDFSSGWRVWGGLFVSAGVLGG